MLHTIIMCFGLLTDSPLSLDRIIKLLYNKK